MAYVAWDKICRPIEEGGLGIKDLACFNEALLLKYLWKLASGCDTQWSALIRAKYIPRSLLWQSERTYNCTIFWRSLMNLRDKLKSRLQWKLAGGNQCHAFGEPWFEGAMDISPPNRQCMTLLVSDLRDESRGLWNTQLLIELYGYANCLVILNSVHLSNEEGQRDVLICNMSANGGFRVKDAYNILRGVGNGNAVGSAKLWNWVWKRGNIAPRIRIFIWKLIRKALPLGATLASRGIQVDTICAICAECEEDTNHMAFLCPFARACWYSSNLGITSHSLTAPMVDTLTEMIEVIDENQWTEIVNSIWALWRCRNDATYGGNKPEIQSFRDYYARIQQESQLIGTARQPRKRQEDNLIPGGSDDNQMGRVKCWVDGSWIRNWNGGIGAVICKGEELLLYASFSVKACSPLQTEAIALIKAVQEVQSLGILVCDFITDCEELQQLVCSPQPPLESTWSAFVECFTIWNLLRAIPGYRCYHIERSQNRLADLLAVKGRVEEWELRGYTYPMFKPD